MFVAIVHKDQPDTGPDSHRDTGGWEAFVGYTQEEAIDKAVAFVKVWETQLGSNGKPRGPYRVLVGELTTEAKLSRYELLHLGRYGESTVRAAVDETEPEDVPF